MPAAIALVPARAAAYRYWLRLGWISFGGPAGQIAILYRELVEARHWVSDAQFVRAVNFCMLLPGPEALQVVIYLGWRWHGRAAGIVAGLLFLLPGAVMLVLLSFGYVLYGGLVPVAGALAGLKAVVVALVALALARLARRALDGWPAVALAGAAFLVLATRSVPFPAVILLAALAGAAWFRRPAPGAAPPPARWRDGARVLGSGALLWLLPWLALRLAGAAPFYAQSYRLFTTAALSTFGGAYAVLAYVNHELGVVLGWLTPPQLLAGLALAETTPGPLVIVLQFYGFLAGWNHAGTAAPALLAAGLACWATFLPSFVLVLALAPHLERLTANPRLGAALAGVTAAIVGVIGSFALTVSHAVLVPRGLGAPDWGAVAIALAALIALGRGAGLVPVLAAGALAGLGLAFAG